MASLLLYTTILADWKIINDKFRHLTSDDYITDSAISTHFNRKHFTSKSI